MDKRRGLSANQIKLIAVCAMTADHLAWTVWPGYERAWYALLLHTIARIGAPLMWFFIAEGYYHTKDLRKYISRLFLFSILSHFAYAFAFGLSFFPLVSGVVNQTSVIFALLCGLVLLAITDADTLPLWAKLISVVILCALSFPADWSCIATLAIVGMGHARKSFFKQMLWMTACAAAFAAFFFFFSDRTYAFVQLGVLFSVPILACYNGKIGRVKQMKWVFYWYYPAHLVLIGFLRIILKSAAL